MYSRLHPVTQSSIYCVKYNYASSFLYMLNVYLTLKKYLRDVTRAGFVMCDVWVFSHRIVAYVSFYFKKS